MMLQVYCVADKAVEAYMPPFYARARGEAIRSFSELVNRKDNNVNKYPAQFTLCYLGEFDDSSGLFKTFEPEDVIEATECVEVAAEVNPFLGRTNSNGKNLPDR